MSVAREDEDALIWADVPEGAPRRLLTAALECFATQGYHATTTRDISLRAGMSPAAIYIHYSSKADVLYRISRAGHEASLRTLEEATARAESAPQRLEALVTEFAGWHARNHRLARVVQYELDAVPEDRSGEIRELRRRASTIVHEEVAHGVRAGDFRVPDVAGATLAILSLCIDVARWYSPSGSRTPEQIGTLYAELVLGMLGCPTSPASS